MAQIPCRLRKLRKAARLSQRELAALLGLKSQGVLSDIETGRKRPGLIIALASAIIFDRPVGEIFPDLALHNARTVLAAAQQLLAANRQAARGFLASLVDRLDAPS